MASVVLLAAHLDFEAHYVHVIYVGCWSCQCWGGECGLWLPNMLNGRHLKLPVFYANCELT